MADIIAFDPGYATGIASGIFDDDSPLELTGVVVIPYEDWWYAFKTLSSGRADHVVAEQFELNSGNEFTADLTGVKVEGTLDLLYGSDLVYRPRSSKVQVPDELLRKIGWWQTGKDVSWSDGRDANDAIIHMLGHVAFGLKHKPTLAAYFKND